MEERMGGGGKKKGEKGGSMEERMGGGGKKERKIRREMGIDDGMRSHAATDTREVRANGWMVRCS